MSKNIIELEEVSIRFSGDSGDGMQLTGTLFSETSAFLGNDVSTFPDYPAEIRAPKGTVGGVSGFQIHLGHTEINTPGDFSDVLIAMNPAALKANAKWIKQGGTVIVDVDAFTAKNIERAGYKEDPLLEEKLKDHNVIEAKISSMTKEALIDSGLDEKTISRCRNMFALGLCYWLFNRPLEYTERFFDTKFGKKPQIADANKKVLHAGYHYGETIEAVTPSYNIEPANIEKGKYRNINGNVATAWGLIAAAKKSNLTLFLGSYPITPASEILQELSNRKDLGVKVIQAEDEIAGICTAIGASFTGNLAVTSTSGPGLALKTEAIGLAVITELPLVIVNVQRAGPSTGLPTKSEQGDLMQAIYGRNGESPVVVIAASTPSDCFYYAFVAAKIAVEHMTPVILLTDGFLANSSEPFKIPSIENDYPNIKVPRPDKNDKDWMPYRRNPETLARTWALPGDPNFVHRIGSLEKNDITGTVSYDPLTHEKMVKIREEKVQRIANYIPELELDGNETDDILVIGWGGTYGHILTAINELRKEGKKIAFVHFHYIKPLPKNTKDILEKFKNKKIIIAELNAGQFRNHLVINFPEYKYLQFNKVQGQPFTVKELKDKFASEL